MPPFKPADDPDLTPDDLFAAYDAARPTVWRDFVRLTLNLIAVGRKLGARDVLAQVRWNSPPPVPGDPYRVNDRWHSRYARKFHKEYPQHDGFFEVRKGEKIANALRPADRRLYARTLALIPRDEVAA